MVAEERAGEASDDGRLGPAALDAGEGWLKPDGQPHALTGARGALELFAAR